jgi:PAS domain S-box-containing protein
MSSPRILLVEDEGIVALDIQSRLRRLGYSVTGIAPAGEAAIQAATREPPDLALVDIRLKGSMDGIEVARHFRDKLHVPVVFLTAYTDAATVERAKQTEPFGYLVKPFDEKELHTTIEVALHNCRMEAKLRDSQEWLSAILRCIGDGVIATDRNLTVRFLNPVAEAVTGCSGRDAIGRPLSRVFRVSAEGDELVPRDPAARAIQENSPISSRGAVHVSKDGVRRVLDLTAWPIRGADGRPVGAVLAMRDITEFRRASAALAEKARELARSNEELERFASVASHDLQEPLRMVSSYVRLLANRYKDKLDADTHEFIHYITEGSQRMQKLIRELLAYSRVSTRKREVETVDCELVLQQALMNLSASIRESGAVVTHDRLPSIAGDSTQILQLFQNLLSNGIKFRGPEAPRIHVSAAAEQDQWVFSVRDNGMGVDPGDAERIFMVFERGRALHGNSGTGLGLAICKKIVEAHGGRIWVDSRPGEGSTFRFAIPMPGGELAAGLSPKAKEDSR